MQLPYLHFLKKIMRGNPGQPVIVTEVRHVSLRLCLQAAPIDATAHLIAAILQRHGFPDACVIGHSFGTFHASRLCQLHRSVRGARGGSPIKSIDQAYWYTLAVQKPGLSPACLFFIASQRKRKEALSWVISCCGELKCARCRER